jgi:hypothetical protein
MENLDIEPTLIITEETAIQTNKRKLSHEEPEQNKRFHIGIFTGCTNHKKKKQNPKYKKKVDKKRPIHEPIVKEDPAAKQVRIVRSFTQNNPYFVHSSVKRILQEDKTPQPLFQKKQGFSMIIPNLNQTYMPYTSAYLYLQYFHGTLFDWQLKLKEITLFKPLFSDIRSQFKFKIPYQHLYGPSHQFSKSAQELYETNQYIRWNLKKLLLRWLCRKAANRILDVDLISLESVPQEERLPMICMKSRSTYVFSGSSLLKTVRSSLESQSGSISNVKTPKNPFTNVPFTYAQLLYLTTQLAFWCLKKGKPLPAIITLYRESNFSTTNISRLHNNYLQYNATKTYMFNDDISGIFFLENLEVLLDSFEHYLPRFSRYLDVELFRAWLQEDRENTMLKNWKQLVIDYWHYKQTEHFIRARWTNEMSILEDLEILFRASENKLRDYF